MRVSLRAHACDLLIVVFAYRRFSPSSLFVLLKVLFLCLALLLSLSLSLSLLCVYENVCVCT